MFMINSEHEAREYVMESILAVPSRCIRLFQNEFKKNGWSLASNDVDDVIGARSRTLLAISERREEPRELRWLEPADISTMPSDVLEKLIRVNPRIELVYLFVEAMKAKNTAAAGALVDLINQTKLNVGASILLHPSFSRDYNVFTKITNRLYTRVIKNIVDRVTYPENMRFALMGILQERNIMISNNTVPIDTPWISEEDIVKLEPGLLQRFLEARTDLQCTKAILNLCKDKCDRSEHIVAIAKAARHTARLDRPAFEIATSWPRPASRIIDHFRSKHQVKTYDALFDVLPWLNHRDEPGLMLEAAKRPSWQCLFEILISKGFSVQHGGISAISVARDRRVESIPVEATVPVDTEGLVWLSKFSTRHRMISAIRAGCRVRAPNPVVAGANNVDLLKAAQWPMRWTPSTHALLPRSTQASIRTFLLCSRRVTSIPAFLLFTIIRAATLE